MKPSVQPIEAFRSFRNGRINGIKSLEKLPSPPPINGTDLWGKKSDLEKEKMRGRERNREGKGEKRRRSGAGPGRRKPRRRRTARGSRTDHPVANTGRRRTAGEEKNWKWVSFVRSEPVQTEKKKEKNNNNIIIINILLFYFYYFYYVIIFLPNYYVS